MRAAARTSPATARSCTALRCSAGGAFSANGTAASGGGTSSYLNSGTTLLISGVVSGANALTKVGDGTVALSGNMSGTPST